MFTPGGQVLGDETAQTGLQLLVETFHLAIGLRVIAGGEANGSTQKKAECLPELADKLGTSVPHHMYGETM